MSNKPNLPFEDGEPESVEAPEQTTSGIVAQLERLHEKWKQWRLEDPEAYERLVSEDRERTAKAELESLLLRAKTRGVQTTRFDTWPYVQMKEPPPTPAFNALRPVLRWQLFESKKLAPLARPMLFVLSGTPGTQKTTALQWAALHHPRRARYITGPDLLEIIRKSWRDDSKLMELYDVPVLFIDDLGRGQIDLSDARKRFEAENTAIATLLYQRWERQLVTVPSTNLLPVVPQRTDDPSAPAPEALRPEETFAGRYFDTAMADRLRLHQVAHGCPGGWYAVLDGASGRATPPPRAPQQIALGERGGEKR